MKVKATNDFQYYRCSVLRVPKKDGEPFEYECELSVEDFRKLQQGGVVDIDKKLYDRYKNVFEVIEPPKKAKEVNNGD
jgi:hypothetical protein